MVALDVAVAAMATAPEVPPAVPVAGHTEASAAKLPPGALHPEQQVQGLVCLR
jgi:hypothetical protein